MRGGPGPGDVFLNKELKGATLAGRPQTEDVPWSMKPAPGPVCPGGWVFPFTYSHAELWVPGAQRNGGPSGDGFQPSPSLR